MRDVEVFKYAGEGNSLSAWWKVRNPLRIALNFIVVYACFFIPSLSLKRFFYRLIGIKIGRNVSVGLFVMFDIFFPELIEVGDNSILGYSSTILTHEFLLREWRKGKVRIGKNVVVGANTTILPGVEVGDGSVVSALSLVNNSIKPDSFVGGVPAVGLR